jgi:hypothetical protein
MRASRKKCARRTRDLARVALAPGDVPRGFVCIRIMNRLFFRAGPARLAVLAAVVSLILPGPVQALELHRERSGPTDLELVGRLAGVPAGESRFVRWADLRALPTTKLRLTGEFVPGEQEVTVVMLEDLWKQLPRGEGVDVLLTTCRDEYAAVYRQDFITKYRPFLVMEINGEGPEKWPPPGLTFNPAPYVISISADVVPAVAQLLDAPHKKPWGVYKIELASYAERFHDAYAGPWANLSAVAVEGREIWVNSCACCHQGPGTIFAGTKSEQPFPIIAAIACCNRPFFSLYVRTPKQANPNATMEAHPHYTDAQLSALIAFITADGKK